MGGNLKRLAGRAYRAWPLAVVLGAVAVAPTSALAELTVEDLTGKAVSGVGPFKQDVIDAIRDFANRDYRAAYKHLQSAKKSTLRLPPPEIMMARLHFDARQSRAGIAQLEQVRRRLPNDPEALVMLAELALVDGRWTGASLLFAKAAPLVEAYRENPSRRQDAQVRLYSGWAAVDEHDAKFADAQKKLAQLVRLDSRNAAAYERLGKALFRMGKGERAYEQFKAAAAADPKMPPAELAMAAQFSDKNNAEKWLRYALREHGDSVRTQLSVGDYRMAANQLDEAKKHSDLALKLDPDGFEPNLLAGMIARLRADNKVAVKYLSAAHLLSPADAGIINHLALVLIELPDETSHEQALKFAELNLAHNPNNIDALATLGWVNYRLKRVAEANRLLAAAVKAYASANDDHVPPDIGYYSAIRARDVGKIPDAIELLRDALNINRPFAYRKPATELLGELEGQSNSNEAAEKPTGSQNGTATGEPADRTDSSAGGER